MSKFDFDLGVIGGGSAGLTAASGAAQLGAKTLLIEREPKLGGDCLHYGCVPSKTLIQSAHVYHLMKQADRFGLPAPDPGPVDFKAVAARIKNVIAAIQPHDSEERFCSLGVKVVFGRAAFTDEHTVETQGQSYSAARWLIATGSSPGAPPLPGLAETGYLTNKEIFYMDRLPASWIILGGGPIAVEMAQAFNRLGSKVRLIQRGGQILSREDRDMSAMVQQALEAEGVEIHTGTSVKQVRSASGLKEVVFEQNGRGAHGAGGGDPGLPGPAAQPEGAEPGGHRGGIHLQGTQAGRAPAHHSEAHLGGRRCDRHPPVHPCRGL